MTHENEPTLADTLGKGYAHLQHGMDRVIEWGFSKMKETGTSADDTVIRNPALRRAAAAGRGILSFLGRAGESYYRTYDDLKKKRQL